MVGHEKTELCTPFLEAKRLILLRPHLSTHDLFIVYCFVCEHKPIPGLFVLHVTQYGPIYRTKEVPAKNIGQPVCASIGYRMKIYCRLSRCRRTTEVLRRAGTINYDFYPKTFDDPIRNMYN